MAPLSSERGDTLIEVLMATSIMGIAVVAIVASMFSLAASTATHRAQASEGAVVRDAAEYVKVLPYQACASSYSTTGFSAPPRSTVSATSVEYWDGSAFQSSCGTDRGLQRVTVRAASNDGRATETIQILKRTP